MSKDDEVRTIRRNPLTELVVIMGMGIAGLALAILITWLVFERDDLAKRGERSEVPRSSKESSQTPMPEAHELDKISMLQKTIDLQHQELDEVKRQMAELQRQLQTAIEIGSIARRQGAESLSEKPGSGIETTKPPVTVDKEYQAQRDSIEASIVYVDSHIKNLERKRSEQRRECDERMKDVEYEEKGGSGTRLPGRGPLYKMLSAKADAACSAVKGTEQQLSEATGYRRQLVATAKELQQK